MLAPVQASRWEIRIEPASFLQPFTLTMDTEFPSDPAVAITITGQRRAEGTIWVRVPTWAAEPMPIAVNDQVVVTGPGEPTAAWEEAYGRFRGIC
jgi:DUF1680 family protein